MIRQGLVPAAVVALALLVPGAARTARDPDKGWIKLFNGTDFSGWKKFLDPRSKVSPEKILLQSEGAEIYFRNVELKHLKQLP